VIARTRRTEVDRNVAEQILQLLDGFSEPITNLSNALEKVEDEETRRRYRRVLGDVMGKLDGEIGYPIRKEHGILE
jgi:hypothetical protein